MGPNPNAFFVDFQMDWPMLLFRSRPLVSCRDIIHVATSISRRDINLSLCRLQMVAPDVATSISCRDINLMNCNFQLMVPDVATSIPCRDISSYLCSFQLMSSVVATSILCRDITLCLCRFHWLLLVSRHQSSVATIAEVTAVSSFQT